MSARIDIRSGLLAAVSAANPGVAISTWDGEEAVFNQAREWPSLAVAYAGTEFGEHEELGNAPSATYARTHVFHLFVNTQHTQGLPGDEQAGKDGYGDIW